jgi:hypothetical protein
MTVRYSSVSGQEQVDGLARVIRLMDPTVKAAEASTGKGSGEGLREVGRAPDRQNESAGQSFDRRRFCLLFGAGEEIRTLDVHLGKTLRPVSGRAQPFQVRGIT